MRIPIIKIPTVIRIPSKIRIPTLKINKISLAYLYIFCIVFSLLIDQPTFRDMVPGRVRYIFNGIIIIFGCLPLLHNKRILARRSHIYYVLSCALPYVAIMILSFITANEPIYGEIITTTLYWLIPIFTMYSAVYLFSEKAVDYTFYALAINYVFNIFVSIIKNDSGLLEVHSVTLTFGMLILYYLLFNKDRKKLIISTVFFLLGFKRIAIIAIPLAILTYAMVNKKPNKVKIIINMLAILTFATSFIYIYIIRSGFLDVLVLKFDINTMSRIQAYNYFNSYYTLSPDYWGTGVGFVMMHLKGLGQELHSIGDLHNDILKMYIELGFFGFFGFFINMIIFQTNRLLKMHYKVGIIYFTILIYTLILCFTDNILRYNVYLIVFYMIPLVSHLKFKSK